LYHKQPGGGGYGDPLSRDPMQVQSDVQNGRVSIEAAESQYGVILDPKSLQLNVQRTAECRRKLR